MNPDPTVFAQVFGELNQMKPTRVAARFPMPRASRSLSVYDHFAAMVFAQLTYRESLRDLEACLRSRSARAYPMGIRGRVNPEPAARGQTDADRLARMGRGVPPVGSVVHPHIAEPQKNDAGAAKNGDQIFSNPSSNLKTP